VPEPAHQPAVDEQLILGFGVARPVERRVDDGIDEDLAVGGSRTPCGILRDDRREVRSSTFPTNEYRPSGGCADELRARPLVCEPGIVGGRRERMLWGEAIFRTDDHHAKPISKATR